MTMTTPSAVVEEVALPVLDQPSRDVVLPEHLDHPLGRTESGVEDGDPPAVGQPALDVDHGLLDVAAVGLRGLRRDHPGLDPSVIGARAVIELTAR